MVASFFTAFDPQLKITVREGKVFDGQDKRIGVVCLLPEVDVFTETLEENAMVQYKDRQAMVVLKGVEDNFEELTAIESWWQPWVRDFNLLILFKCIYPNGMLK